MKSKESMSQMMKSETHSSRLRYERDFGTHILLLECCSCSWAVLLSVVPGSLPFHSYSLPPLEIIQAIKQEAMQDNVKF